jgi:hypothetical protein
MNLLLMFNAGEICAKLAKHCRIELVAKPVRTCLSVEYSRRIRESMGKIQEKKAQRRGMPLAGFTRGEVVFEWETTRNLVACKRKCSKKK